MEETLATVAIDLSGRYALVFRADFPPPRSATSTASSSRTSGKRSRPTRCATCTSSCHYGRNSHHISEAIFKATARALRMAVESDPRMPGVPSTKGTLDG